LGNFRRLRGAGDIDTPIEAWLMAENDPSATVTDPPTTALWLASTMNF
jgi:hypothetical protein